MIDKPLFKKAAVFGDIHWGKRSDSPVHNQDCMRYIEWFCKQAELAQVDTIIFVGDWYDNRSRLRLDTISIANTAMRMLVDVAEVYMISGNHDMFFKQNRDVTSIDAYAGWKGVHLYNSPTVISQVGFVPYMVGTEYLEVLDMDVKYMFGHFELPGFLMNASIEMPNKGQFNSEQITRPDYVFSGHFHKRQLKVNSDRVPVWYIGNPFGHDFNDVGDAQRGMMLLSWDNDPEFVDWDEGPLYQRFSTSEILDLIDNESLDKVTRPTSILEIKDNLGLELEEISFIREELNQVIREARVYQRAQNPGVEMETEVADIDDKSLNEVVVEHLQQIDPRGSDIDPSYLVKLFNGKKENDCGK